MAEQFPGELISDLPQPFDEDSYCDDGCVLLGAHKHCRQPPLPTRFWAAGILLGEFVCWYCMQRVDPTMPHDCPDQPDQRGEDRAVRY